MRPILKLVMMSVLSAAVGCSGVARTSVVPGSTGAVLSETVQAYHLPITTDSAEAQRWFDQGLQLVYGFNHGEAIRSFREAAARDPEAAMPWWGIAYASGMHINVPEVTEGQWHDCRMALQQARLRLDDESALEFALVRAIEARCPASVPPEQRPIDEAYASEMAQVWAAFPDQPDVGVLYAESLMNLQPWDYWTESKAPKGNTEVFVGVLERVLQLDPHHPQGCHLYIHALEAGPSPERAVPAAERLEDRVPGAGHLVHMPSHIYARVGRYADAVETNVRAVEADEAFFAQGTEPGMYWIYHAHNVHFLAFAAMMEGQYEIAMDAARRLETALPEAALDQFAFLIEGIIPTTYHVQIRFGRWEDVLREDAPPAKRPVMLAVHYYARGIALSALGRTEEARTEIAKFNEQVKEVPGDWWIFSNKVHDVLPIAHAMLEGELAFREGRLDDAWAALERGIAAEDRLVYDEPPGWMLPVRHAMGALLMSAGEYERAEKLYREDQIAHPGNGWSLLGLKQSLEQQGRRAEAGALANRVDAAFARISHEDRPTSSCLCEPGD